MQNEPNIPIAGAAPPATKKIPRAVWVGGAIGVGLLSCLLCIGVGVGGYLILPTKPKQEVAANQVKKGVPIKPINAIKDGMVQIKKNELVEGESGEEQKRLMERHKKVMLDMKANGSNAVHESAQYLLKRRAGIPFVEDRIIEYRKQKMIDGWSHILDYYRKVIVVEDVPDKMIPEFAAKLEMDKGGYTVDLISHAAEFGPRGKAFLPSLEWIRDNSMNDQTIRSAGDAIRKIKARP